MLFPITTSSTTCMSAPGLSADDNKSGLLFGGADGAL